MADIKVVDLTTLNSASANDVLPIVDVETNTTKKITKSDFLKDGYTDGSIPGSALTNYSVPASKLNAVWWEEIGRTTLSVAAFGINVSFSPRKFMQVHVNLTGQPDGGNVNFEQYVRFNGDDALHYGYTFFFLSNNPSPTVNTGSVCSQAEISLDLSPVNRDNMYGVMNIMNNTTTSTNKVMQWEGAYTGDNVANWPVPFKSWGHWTSNNRITTINWFNAAQFAGKFAPGSEIVVLGHD